MTSYLLSLRSHSLCLSLFFFFVIYLLSRRAFFCFFVVVAIRALLLIFFSPILLDALVVSFIYSSFFAGLLLRVRIPAARFALGEKKKKKERGVAEHKQKQR